MRLFSLLFALTFAFGTLAADAQIPPRGEATTFDVATWNIENFGTGSGGATQRDNAIAVIRAADVDLWALQEIVDVNDFNALLQELENDGYRGILGPDPQFGNQRLAYVYKEDVVTVIASGTILSGNEFAFASRLPLQLTASVTVGGETQSLRILNIHAKCCGGQDDFERRLEAAGLLKEYTDAEVERGRAVMLLGDYNDGLNFSITSGQRSPYRPYRGDTDSYTIATFDTDRLSRPTFCSNTSCSSGSTLDHILFSNDLAASFVEDSDPRYIDLVQAVSGYVNTTSDHIPVVARFTLVPTAGEAAPEDSGVALLPPAPTPFRESTTLRFQLAEPGPVQIDVFDSLGRRVERISGTYPAGEHSVRLDGASLAEGLYLARLTASGVTATQTLVRVDP